MTLREQIDKIRREFPDKHPIIKGMVYLALIIGPITLVAYLMGWGDQNMQADMKDFIKKTDFQSLFLDVVIVAPFVEELLYRGPAFLMLMACGLTSWFLKAAGRNPFLENFVIWKIRLEDVVVWPIILIPTYYWAQMHPFPLPIFCTGIVFGWIMMRTRNILWNMLAHAILNMIVLLGIVLKFSFFY